MPNPSADSSSTYALKPDFSFAFKDWIAGGVETLMWSFRGTLKGIVYPENWLNPCIDRQLLGSMFFGHPTTPVQVFCVVLQIPLQPSMLSSPSARPQTTSHREIFIKRHDHDATLWSRRLPKGAHGCHFRCPFCRIPAKRGWSQDLRATLERGIVRNPRIRKTSRFAQTKG